MPIDGIFLKHLCSELRGLIGTRTDKIFQPSRDELVLSLRSAGFSGKLLLSAKSGMARVQLTNESFENPASPPMFCMLMRKHLSGARLVDVTQDGYERCITFHFSATDELGDRRILRLTAELIGNKSNIILINEDGRIIDALRRSDIESQARLVQPGALFTPPPALQKLDPTDPTVTNTVLCSKKSSLSAAILESISGVSPLIAGETAFAADPLDREPASVDMAQLKAAMDRLCFFEKNGKPHMLISPDGVPKDFSYMPIHHYGSGYSIREYDSFCGLLDAFYSERDKAERLRQSASALNRLLKNLKERTDKKSALRREELKSCTDREKYRIYGELIKANIAMIPRGAVSAEVPNYYDEELKNVTIPLDPALSPAENSAKYFKEYRKKCTAESTLHTLIKHCDVEAEYIASVKDALDRAQSAAEISEIEKELTAAGYIRRSQGKQQPKKALPPIEYTSPDGFRVSVGRNNLQNDTLTLRTASKTDIWLHTKDIHGSHTVISTNNGTAPESTLLFAAEKAAYHSSARFSSRVPVDYTLIKHVKKPSGARPGSVIYTHQSTLYVTPNGD